MKLIISHSNTDFDGLAGMVAAQKLHPDARIVLRGNEEPQVKNFLENPFYTFPASQVTDIDLSEVTEIICVDFSRYDRLGNELTKLDLNTITFTVYDHHENKSEITGRNIIVEPIGAVTTLLVERLLAQQHNITQLEATLYMLGIYEDTGMLLHVNTTSRDVRAVAALMDLGADLKIVNRFMRYEFSNDQIMLFNALISSTEVHDIEHTAVAVGRASFDNYIPDAAVVVQKIMEIEGHLSFFAVMRMGEKIQIIGRSKDDALDVGSILSLQNGGGHASAGSASISGKTIVEVIEVLLSNMRGISRSAYTASDIMTKNLISTTLTKTLRQVRNLFTRHNINVVPVIQNGIVHGIITRQQVDRAIAHRLRGTVKEFMRSDFSIIDAETGIHEVEHLLMSGTERALLVGIPPDKAEGIITRMDLFRRLYLEKLPKQSAATILPHKRSHNIAEMVGNRLPVYLQSIIKKISMVCKDRNEHAYLVGGIVRDIFLNLDNADVDILVSGNAISFAKALSKIVKCRIHSHERFGTAIALFDDNFRIDFASARSESYSAPGALPEVRSGGLRADMFRRDFTINAMAMSLHPDNYGQLVDYFGGRRDLQNKTVRILHSLSFIDDPTRILRALRFCARLGFSLSRGTLDSLTVSLHRKMLWRVSGKRLLNELNYIFTSGRAIKSVELMDEHGVLQALHRKFKLDRFTRTLLERIGKTVNWFNINFPDEDMNTSLPYLMALMEKLTGQERSALARKFRLSTKEKSKLVEYKQKIKRIIVSERKGLTNKPSKMVNLFDSTPIETMIYAHAFVFSEVVRESIRKYLSIDRFVKISVTGDDINDLGLPQGSEYAHILNNIRDAKLDGKIISSDDEMNLLKKLVKKSKTK